MSHDACRCGCGELADECSGPHPAPLGSMTTTPPRRLPPRCRRHGRWGHWTDEEAATCDAQPR